MKKELFYKVKYGFNVADTVSIPESELEKAIYAQVVGTPTKLGNIFVKGSNIISITPNYHKYTGWNDYYEPKDGEDFKQIQRDCPNFDGVLEYYKDRVEYLMKNGKQNLIGTGEEIPGLPNKFLLEESNSNSLKELSDKFRIK